MKLLQKIGFLAAACALLVTTFSIIGPRAVHAITATLVRDADNPALQPFITECSTGVFDFAGRGSCTLAMVPNGKRFVIETISGSLQLGTGIKPISIDLQVVSGAAAADNFFPATFQGNSAFFTGDFYTVYQAVRLYANAGTTPFFNLTLSNGTPVAVGELTAAGYLVNVP
jgi:hypothetical protein